MACRNAVGVEILAVGGGTGRKGAVAEEVGASSRCAELVKRREDEAKADELELEATDRGIDARRPSMLI